MKINGEGLDEPPSSKYLYEAVFVSKLLAASFSTSTSSLSISSYFMAYEYSDVSNHTLARPLRQFSSNAYIISQKLYHIGKFYPHRPGLCLWSLPKHLASPISPTIVPLCFVHIFVLWRIQEQWKFHVLVHFFPFPLAIWPKKLNN